MLNIINKRNFCCYSSYLKQKERKTLLELLFINIFFYTITSVALLEVFNADSKNFWIFFLVIPWGIYIIWKVIRIIRLTI